MNHSTLLFLLSFLGFILPSSLRAEPRVSTDQPVACSAQGSGTISELCAQQILKTLHHQSGITSTVQLSIIKDAEPSAITVTPQHIVISTGLLNTLTSNDEVAFVIAHELGHISLLQNNRTFEAPRSFADETLTSLINEEFKADYFAVQLVQRSGYQISPAIRLLRSMADRFKLERTARSAALQARASAVQKLLTGL